MLVPIRRAGRPTCPTHNHDRVIVDPHAPRHGPPTAARTGSCAHCGPESTAALHRRCQTRRRAPTSPSTTSATPARHDTGSGPTGRAAIGHPPGAAHAADWARCWAPLHCSRCCRCRHRLTRVGSRSPQSWQPGEFKNTPANTATRSAAAPSTRPLTWVAPSNYTHHSGNGGSCRGVEQRVLHNGKDPAVRNCRLNSQ